MRLVPDQVLALAAVVETGSFDAAAARLGVTPSAVSQRIKALERQVGSVVVRRARPCTATEAGLPLVRLAAQWVELEAQVRAELGVADGAARPRLAVAVNADSLSTWFPPALVAVARDAVVDVHREDQDHSARLLRDGTVMAAVTADPSPVQGCATRRLGAMRYLAVATPTYVAEHLPDGATADALAVAPMMAFNRKDALQHRFLEDVVGARLDPPAHHVPSSAGFVELVRRGVGWGMLPDAAAADDLASGALVELVPGRVLDVPLFWQHWRIASPPLERLTAAVLHAARCGLHGVSA